MANDGPKPTSQSSSAFQRFEALTKKLIAVPKREVDKQQAKWKRNQAKAKRHE